MLSFSDNYSTVDFLCSFNLLSSFFIDLNTIVCRQDSVAELIAKPQILLEIQVELPISAYFHCLLEIQFHTMLFIRMFL